MSEPYNPCDEKEDVARVAKSWELLRRNPRFRAAFEAARNGEIDGSWPDRVSRELAHRIAWEVLRIVLDHRPELKDYWADPPLIDLSADEARERVPQTFVYASPLYLNDWKIYIVPLDEHDEARIVRRGGEICFTDTRDPADYDDHYIAVIPRSVPSPGHLEALKETIERLVTVTGKDKRKTDPGGARLGTRKQWDAFLHYECFAQEIVPYTKELEREVVNAATKALYPGVKNPRNHTGKFREYRKAILNLIEAAYPA